jgi:hypothetical protein
VRECDGHISGSRDCSSIIGYVDDDGERPHVRPDFGCDKVIREEPIDDNRVLERR